MIVECSRWRRSNILTDPSAPTDANISRPPPAIEKMFHVILDKFLWIKQIIKRFQNILFTFAECNVIYFLVVSNKLCFDLPGNHVDPANHLPCF